MGTYINPGNAAFKRISGPNYVDKTMLIELLNQRIPGENYLVCVSRPRRFGKSYAAKMLSAYYDCSCDSHSLFDNRKIAECADYTEHLNQYNVISLDITSFISEAKSLDRPLKDVSKMIREAIHDELIILDPDLKPKKTLVDELKYFVEKPNGKQWVFIIDEWDAMIREAKNDAEAQQSYLSLLRGWFKNNGFTDQCIAVAYMTGILPIKKDGSQSAISDFEEFPILSPGEFAGVTGFTEEEVKGLCEKHSVPFDDFKAWYDGYDFPECGEIYNPYSVMCAIRSKKCKSYWKKTAASESLFTYINMDFDGIQEIITRLISGEEIDVKTDGFQNDFEQFSSRDDVLTLLVHLGYLTYNEDKKTVRIPNEEVRSEYYDILNSNKVNSKWIKLIDRSKKLLKDTMECNAKAVVQAIKAIRQTEYAPTFYNNEQSLRYIIKFAYVAAIDQFMKIEELPSGHGIADVVYIPKRMSPLPALLIELKYNKSAGGAIAQIKNKQYPSAFQNYGGDVILVGINYSTKKDEHTCEIEMIHFDEN